VVVAPGVVASVVVLSVVVSVEVDAPVVSEVVEEVVVDVLSSAFSGENGFPSASAPDAMTPSMSIAASPAATLPSPDFLSPPVRPFTLFLPSRPQPSLLSEDAPKQPLGLPSASLRLPRDPLLP